MKLVSDVGSLSNLGKDVEGKLGGVGSLVKGWGIAMAADVAISIGAGIVDGIKGGFEDARLAEAVETQLGNTFENLDLGTMQELDSIMESIGSRALDLGFDDTASLQAFDEFLRLTHDTDEATKLLQASWDLARASGDDLSTSATTVSGAYRGQSRALAQFGVEGVAGIEAVDAAWATFAGSADEHMTTADGRMERFQGRIDEIFEGIASVVLGLADPFLDVLDALDPVLVSISEGIGRVSRLVDALAPTFETVFGLIQPLVENLGVIFGTVFEAIGGLIDTLILLLDGDFSGAFEALQETVQGVIDGIMEYFANLLAFFSGIVDTFGKVAGNIGGAILGGIATGVNAITGLVKGVFNAVIDIWNSLDFSIDFDWDGPGIPNPLGGWIMEPIKVSVHTGDLIPDIPYLARGGIVTDPTLAVIGEAGPEAVVPLDGRHGIGGNTYNITVNAAAASPADVGRAVVEAIHAYERRAGRRWRTA